MSLMTSGLAGFCTDASDHTADTEVGGRGRGKGGRKRKRKRKRKKEGVREDSITACKGMQNYTYIPMRISPMML